MILGKLFAVYWGGHAVAWFGTLVACQHLANAIHAACAAVH